MPSKAEKKRRAALVQAIVDKDTKEAIAAMPISFHDLKDLFDYLDIQLEESGCNHSPKITIGFLESRQLKTEIILNWLQKQGGYCDCEILWNVEESWEDEIKKHTRNN